MVTFRQALGLATPSHTRYVPPLPQCGLCKLCDRNLDHGKMPVSGRGRKGVLIIGEAPGSTEDRRGKPFVGDAGQVLRGYLHRLGVDLDRDCWTTNAVICWPWEQGTRGGRRNRTPTDKEVGYCLPNVVNTLKKLDPAVVVLLGGVPMKSVLGWLWKESIGPVGRWVGWQIPSQRLNAWVCPTWHPSFLMRERQGNNGRERQDYAVLERYFLQHLKAAFRRAERGKPYDVVKDFHNRVKVLLDPTEAAHYLRTLLSEGTRRYAVDYETNMLKPDGDKAFIYSCAVSNGDATLAYPWTKETRAATWELLRSPIPKIASNQKFEERWTLKEFGHGVRNWVWDTMLAAHVLDNRPDVCSIKFQAFVRLGVDSWDGEVKPYLQSKGGGNSENRIREAPLETLLTYNGLDALLEYKVAMIQSKQLGISLGG